MKIVVCGDLHGEFIELHDLIKLTKPDIVLQCGDFGYWPNSKQFDINLIDPGETKVYFCPGNHEHWDSLDKLEDNEIVPNVFYMKKGSILELPDGRNVLFAGGAYSIDKAWRVPGHDWFPQEQFTGADVDAIDHSKKVDIVISHTLPNEFVLPDNKINFSIKSNDGSRFYLDEVLDTFRPSLFFSGHWHNSYQDTYQFSDGTTCEWTLLDMVNGRTSHWWDILK